MFGLSGGACPLQHLYLGEGTEGTLSQFADDIKSGACIEPLEAKKFSQRALVRLEWAEASELRVN